MHENGNRMPRLPLRRDALMPSQGIAVVQSDTPNHGPMPVARPRQQIAEDGLHMRIVQERQRSKAMIGHGVSLAPVRRTGAGSVLANHPNRRFNSVVQSTRDEDQPWPTNRL